jgi:hypothetical protein
MVKADKSPVENRKQEVLNYIDTGRDAVCDDDLLYGLLDKNTVYHESLGL